MIPQHQAILKELEANRAPLQLSIPMRHNMIILLVLIKILSIADGTGVRAPLMILQVLPQLLIARKNKLTDFTKGSQICFVHQRGVSDQIKLSRVNRRTGFALEALRLHRVSLDMLH